ncbi:MAG: putative type secretion system protein [Candidatus Midichloriaceae bacterium]|nr:putative type secretion system protein [Candidatus Midichloriaceae bacterium]
MTFKILIHNLILAVFLLIAAPTQAKECVARYDFGQGTTFYIPSNPGKKNLIVSSPSNKQIAPWVATNFSVIGASEDEKNQKLRIRVHGQWFPWGGGNIAQEEGAHPTALPSCTLVPCDAQAADQAPCLDGGLHIKVEPDGSNIPCSLSDGWGLYGLIALDKDSRSADPNSKEYAGTLPSEYFRTFRVGPLSEDSKGKYFELDATKQCAIDEDGQTVCFVDSDENGKQQTLKGSLYFKIIDSNYDDNEGEYAVTILTGVAAKKGIIQQSIGYFTDTLNKVTEKLFRGLTSDFGFISMVRAILFFYIALTGIMFMMGLINSHIAELVIRLFKVSLVVALISESSWEFFNTYLFSLFTDGAQSIATLMTKAAFTYSEQYGDGQFIFPEDAHSVSVFDSVLNMLIAPAIHFKIWGLLFYKSYFFAYIIFIYVCIYLLLLAIVRSCVLYIVSIMLVGLLLAISPLFIIMILFKVTKTWFDDWLKQLLVNAMLLIVISVTMALMVNLILINLEKMLDYGVCWDAWPIYISSWHIFDVWFWKPTDPSQIEKCLTPLNFFSFLFVCILFNSFMQQIPDLIDSLASSGLMPVSTLYAKVMNKSSPMTNKIMSYVHEARALATPTALLLLFKGGRSLLQGRDEFLEMGHQVYGSLENKYSKAVSGSGLAHTDTAQWARDKVGGVVDVVDSTFKPRNRGIFDSDKGEHE